METWGEKNRQTDENSCCFDGPKDTRIFWLFFGFFWKTTFWPDTDYSTQSGQWMNGRQQVALNTPEIPQEGRWMMVILMISDGGDHSMMMIKGGNHWMVANGS